MEQPGASALLEQLIFAKEELREAEGKLLKVHFLEAYESLKPVNLIRSTIEEAAAVPGLKALAGKAVMGFILNIVAKKLFAGKEPDPLVKLTVSFVETIITNRVEKT
ncbi:MAG: hypothetical protein FD123_4144 [Bacteroidetes bacterium]|nr:MAG: hypothetical protein FD123_4144 [Bacteroidota bacterium]